MRYHMLSKTITYPFNNQDQTFNIHPRNLKQQIHLPNTYPYYTNLKIVNLCTNNHIKLQET